MIRSKPLQYILIGFILWVIVDLGTAGGFRLDYFREHGPLLLAFYLGFPVAFSYLIFGCRWSGWKLLMATFVAMFVVEGAFTRNPFVLSFPLLLIGVPLAVCVYAPLTYFPVWIVRGEMGKHKVIVAALSTVVLVVILLTTFGSGSQGPARPVEALPCCS